MIVRGTKAPLFADEEIEVGGLRSPAARGRSNSFQ